MTQKQKIRRRNNIVKQQFFNYPILDENDLWRIVYLKTVDKLKWQIEEKVMQKVFVEKKQPYTILRELNIGDIRTYYHYLNNICEIGYMWAKELKAI